MSTDCPELGDTAPAQAASGDAAPGDVSQIDSEADGRPASPTVGVVLVAAGVGARFGRRKSGLELAGRPLASLSLRTLERVPGFCEGVLVAHSDDVDEALRAWIMPHSRSVAAWRVVAGGATRAQSVQRGLEALTTACALVAIHDAARPLLAAEDAAAVIAAAGNGSAAILARPVTDTLKRVRDGAALQTVDRGDLWAAETPQVFHRAALLACHETRRREVPGQEITDDAMFWEMAGRPPVLVVAARHLNFKVTHPSDFDLACAWLAFRAGRA